MLFKCRSFCCKLPTAFNKINIQYIPGPHFNIINNFLLKHLCSSVENRKLLNYDAVTGGDKDLEHKLKVLEMELEVMRQEGMKVPSTSVITVERWKELLLLPSRSARIRLYEFLFKLMKKKEKEKAEKIEKSLKYQQYLAEKENESDDLPLEEFAHKYDLKHNNIILRVYDTTINQFYNNKLIQAILFGEKLIIDCDYESQMTKREILNCAKQIMLLFADNRLHDDPFDLHLCNVNREGVLMQSLKKSIPTVLEPWFPLNIHEKSYLDIFKKEELVYLTPHCREEMTSYDPDTVYIVGGLVDKAKNDPLTLAKAKKEGLRMAKFPLDRYLQWSSGSGKSLTLNQVVSVLLDLKMTGNWDHALRHVPRRKLVSDVLTDIEKASNILPYDRPERHDNSRSYDFAKLTYQNKWRKDQFRSSKKKTKIDLRRIITE